MNKNKYLTIYQLFLFHDAEKPDFRAVIHHIEDNCNYLLLDNIEKNKFIREKNKHSLNKYGLTKYIVKQIKTEIKTIMFYDNPEDEEECLPYKYNTIIDIMLWHDREFPDDDDARCGWGIMGHLVDKLSKSIHPPYVGQTYDEFDAINGDWDWRFELQSEYVLIEDYGINNTLTTSGTQTGDKIVVTN